MDLLWTRGARRWGVEFKCADAPTATKSMHITVHDLSLEHLWVLYPGREKFSLGNRITALPLGRIHEVTLNP